MDANKGTTHRGSHDIDIHKMPNLHTIVKRFYDTFMDNIREGTLVVRVKRTRAKKQDSADE